MQVRVCCENKTTREGESLGRIERYFEGHKYLRGRKVFGARAARGLRVSGWVRRFPLVV